MAAKERKAIESLSLRSTGRMAANFCVELVPSVSAGALRMRRACAER